MIVDEKGLIRAMKEAYKSDGYTVAAEDRAGIENITITNYEWTVIIQRDELPRKILGMIAEHIGEIPSPGQAYLVKKKETQAAIFEDIADSVPKAAGRAICGARKTAIQLTGSSLWQAATGNTIVSVNPEDEDLINFGGCSIVRLVGKGLLMVDDNTSRVFIQCQEPDTAKEAEWLEHLEKIRWVAE